MRTAAAGRQFHAQVRNDDSMIDHWMLTCLHKPEHEFGLHICFQHDLGQAHRYML